MTSADQSLIVDPALDFSDPATPHNAVIVVEEQKLYVQKELLSECSEFFKSLFEPEVKDQNDAKEKIKSEKVEPAKDEINPKKKSSLKLFRGCLRAQNETKIDEIGEEMKAEELKIQEFELKNIYAAEFSEFLKFFYTGNVKVNDENFHYLATLSLRFLTPKILELCETFILQKNSHDVVEMLDFSTKYGMEKIKKHCSSLIAGDQLDETVFPFAEGETRDCDCNTCMTEALKVVYGHPFHQGSFVAKNKQSILNAPVNVQALILDQIIKTKL